jgi:ATP-dependent DNA helicase RecQ
MGIVQVFAQNKLHLCKTTPTAMTKEEALKTYFGYDRFRPLQAEIIDTVLDGNDCLVLMPTGGGKSVCYQIPAVLRPGLAVVISPLIALMKDQVESLKSNGIEARYLNSSQSTAEQQQVLNMCVEGKIKLLYVAPERLFGSGTLDFLKNLNISLFAIDESHCISSWGHDFRPEYRNLNILKDHFPDVPFIALTATADRVTRKDILVQLGKPDAQVFISSFDRPNLSLSVMPGQNRIKQIEKFLEKHPNQPGIIYCLSRKATEKVAEKLQDLGYSVNYYHAGCSSEHRSMVQEKFIKDDLQIMVATIAFGMGIDKPNVRWILHYNLPSNVESYYQEIGRAGRDGLNSETILFYSYGDIITREEMISKSEAPNEQKELWRAKLERMQQYAQSDICRRRVLLSYFSETVEQDCGNCDVCRNPRQRFDGTVIAQKALSAIARTKESVALGMLVDILRGSRNQAVLQRQYDQLPTFGVGKELRNEEWMDYILQFLNSGYLDIAYDEGHVFKLNTLSWKVLKGLEKVKLGQFISFQERNAQQAAQVPAEKTKKEIIKDELFEQLRKLRKEIADSEGVPPYIVFNDLTLSEMAQRKPVSEAQFKAVPGVGTAKYDRYGAIFTRTIKAFLSGREDVKPQTVKGLTYEETFDLFEKGLGVEEIASFRKLSPSTIVGHLFKLKSEGRDINLEILISARDKKAIWTAADQLQEGKTEKFKYGELAEYLQNAFTGWQISLALRLRETEE